MTRSDTPGVAGTLRDAASASSETGFDTQLYGRFPTQEERPAGELEAQIGRASCRERV